MAVAEVMEKETTGEVELLAETTLGQPNFNVKCARILAMKNGSAIIAITRVTQVLVLLSMLVQSLIRPKVQVKLELYLIHLRLSMIPLGTL